MLKPAWHQQYAPTQNVQREPRRAAAAIALFYLGTAGLWILLSDQAVSWLISDPSVQQRMQTIKGWGFVVATAWFLFMLVRRELRIQQANRLLLQSVIEGYDDPVFAKDRQGRYIMVNAAASRGTGLAPDQILGKTVGQVFESPYAETVREIDERVMTTGVAESHERSFTRNDVERTLLVSRSPIRDPDGVIAGVVAVSHDISERKMAEAALRRSEQRFRALVENSFDAVSLIDGDGRITYVSPGAARILGWSPDQVLGKFGFDLVHPDDIADVRRASSEVLDNPQDRPSLEFRLRHSEGSWRWVECAGQNLLADPHIGGVVLNWRDVTEQRRSDEANRKLDAFREAIISTAAEGICVCHLIPEFPFARFTIWNHRMIEITGYTMEDINTCGWHELLYPDPESRRQAMQRRNRVHGGQQLDGEEWVITRRDGVERTVAMFTSSIIDDEGQRAVVGLMHDVTGRHRQERELRQAYETERLLFRELDHRVRNNLSSLMALIELTRRSTQDVATFAKSIFGRVLTMANVHSLLSRSKWTSIDLHALIDMNIPKPAPGEFVTEGPSVAIPPGQANALSMLLHELITNSVKHGAFSQQGGRVRVAWSMGAGDDRGRPLRIEWVETGGRRIAAEPQSGTGLELIRGLVRADLRGTVNVRFPAEGAHHTIDVVLISDQVAINAGISPPEVTRPESN